MVVQAPIQTFIKPSIVPPAKGQVEYNALYAIGAPVPKGMKIGPRPVGPSSISSLLNTLLSTNPVVGGTSGISGLGDATSILNADNLDDYSGDAQLFGASISNASLTSGMGSSGVPTWVWLAGAGVALLLVTQ